MKFQYLDGAKANSYDKCKFSTLYKIKNITIPGAIVMSNTDTIIYNYIFFRAYFSQDVDIEMTTN